MATHLIIYFWLFLANYFVQLSALEQHSADMGNTALGNPYEYCIILKYPNENEVYVANYIKMKTRYEIHETSVEKFKALEIDCGNQYAPGEPRDNVLCFNGRWNMTRAYCKDTRLNAFDNARNPNKTMITCIVQNLNTKSLYMTEYNGKLIMAYDMRNDMKLKEIFEVNCTGLEVKHHPLYTTCLGADGVWKKNLTRCISKHDAKDEVMIDSPVNIGNNVDFKFCVMPNPPEHGKYKIASYLQDGKSYKAKPGMVTNVLFLMVECDKGYKLQGGVYVGCLAGYWFENKTECKLISDEGAVKDEPVDDQKKEKLCEVPAYSAHGRYVARSPSENDLERVFPGSQVSALVLTLECNKGYTLDEQNYSFCMSGRWYNTIMCVEESKRNKGKDYQKEQSKLCTIPNVGATGSYVILGEVNKQIVNVGVGTSSRIAIISVTCDAGYELQQESFSFCSNGEWSDSVPMCYPEPRLDNDILYPPSKKKNNANKLKCHSPKFPKNGRHIKEGVKDGIFTGRKHSLDGLLLMYKCDKGYMLEGPKYVSCSRGIWTEKPICVPDTDKKLQREYDKKECEMPYNTMHGRYYERYFKDNRIDDNLIVHAYLLIVHCNTGYKPKNEYFTVCVNGVLSNPLPLCTPNIPKTQLYTETVSDLKLKDVELVCIAPHSPPNGVYQTYNLQDSTFAEVKPGDPLMSAIVQVICNNGYTREGAHFGECIDGVWKVYPPLCKRM